MGLVETVGHGFLSLHQSVYEATGGVIGHRALGVPCLLLYTTGRKSGTRRTNALVYAKDGSDYVVVPSNGGSDRAPGWLHNVRANPDVEIRVGRPLSPAKARIVESADPDHTRLWRLVNDHNHRRYDGYQSKTERPIPLVVLSPESA
jgi:deazaflavin-dependent oxidoreductase (nitroreductase family)